MENQKLKIFYQEAELCLTTYTDANKMVDFTSPLQNKELNFEEVKDYIKKVMSILHKDEKIYLLLSLLYQKNFLDFCLERFLDQIEFDLFNMMVNKLSRIEKRIKTAEP